MSEQSPRVRAQALGRYHEAAAAAADATDPDPAPRRPALEIMNDLAAARAEFTRMQPLIEKERARFSAAERFIDLVQTRTRRAKAMGVTDEEIYLSVESGESTYRVPPKPAWDLDLTEAYHRQHYVIAALQAELSRFSPGEQLRQKAGIP